MHWTNTGCTLTLLHRTAKWSLTFGVCQPESERTEWNKACSAGLVHQVHYLSSGGSGRLMADNHKPIGNWSWSCNRATRSSKQWITLLGCRCPTPIKLLCSKSCKIWHCGFCVVTLGIHSREVRITEAQHTNPAGMHAIHMESRTHTPQVRTQWFAR